MTYYNAKYKNVLHGTAAGTSRVRSKFLRFHLGRVHTVQINIVRTKRQKIKNKLRKYLFLNDWILNTIFQFLTSTARPSYFNFLDASAFGSFSYFVHMRCSLQDTTQTRVRCVHYAYIIHIYICIYII